MNKIPFTPRTNTLNPHNEQHKAWHRRAMMRPCALLSSCPVMTQVRRSACQVDFKARAPTDPILAAEGPPAGDQKQTEVVQSGR